MRIKEVDFQSIQNSFQSVNLSFWRYFKGQEIKPKGKICTLNCPLDEVYINSNNDFNGQKRIREFYAMKPEEAYVILEAMSEIHDCKENLKLIVPTDVEEQEEQLAQEIDTESHEKVKNFSFAKCQIAVGEEIKYYNDPNIKCRVVSDRKVEYQGKEMSLTAI